MNFRASDAGTFATLVLLASTLLSSPAKADARRLNPLSDWQIVAATGRSITEWGNAWWKWAFDHPEILGDTTGQFAGLGKVRGPVFFAEGSGGEPLRARVDVPHGEYVLLPVATYIWTFFDPCAEIRCARNIINENFIKGVRDVFVRVDGRPVRNLASHLVKVDRHTPQVFLVDAGPIDQDGYGGILPALQGGYWVMLEPLPPGTHTVSFGATIPVLDPVTGEPTGDTSQLYSQLTLRAVACRSHRGCRPTG